MKLLCSRCNLSLNAKDEDRGKAFQCPICRSPLVEAGSEGRKSEAPPVVAVEWAAGTLDELVLLLGAQSISGIIEVHAPDKKGEVRMVAGGIDESTIDGLTGDSAYEALAALPGARFRLEPRLPNESGSLETTGEDRGDLKVRPLAKLMRYCDDIVLTGTLEVWRGTETCAIEYRRGSIERTTVGGIDAPEKLSEVMQWRAGSYRIRLPTPNLPAQVPTDVKEAARQASQGRSGAVVSAGPPVATSAVDGPIVGRTTIDMHQPMATPDRMGKATVIGMQAPEISRGAPAAAPAASAPPATAAPVPAATGTAAPTPAAPVVLHPATRPAAMGSTIVGVPTAEVIAAAKAAMAAPVPPAHPEPKAEAKVPEQKATEPAKKTEPEQKAEPAKKAEPARKAEPEQKAEPAKKADKKTEKKAEPERKSRAPQAKKDEKVKDKKEPAKKEDAVSRAETADKAVKRSSAGTNVVIAVAAAGVVVALWFLVKMFSGQ